MDGSLGTCPWLGEYGFVFLLVPWKNCKRIQEAALPQFCSDPSIFTFLTVVGKRVLAFQAGTVEPCLKSHPDLGFCCCVEIICFATDSQDPKL